MFFHAGASWYIIYTMNDFIINIVLYGEYKRGLT